MPDTLAPVDTAVSIPESVKRAAAAAELAHKAAYNTPDPTPEPTPAPAPEPVPAPVTAQPEPQPALTPTPAPAPEPSAPVTAEEWQSRYHSMEGRFKQSQRTIGSMQEQMSELGSELVKTQSLLRGPRQAPLQPEPLLTEEDRSAYGPDLLNVMKKAAVEAVQPEITTLKQQNTQLQQRLAQQAQLGVFQTLDGEIPNWREINDSDRFKAWCRLPDLYSGVVRGRLLNDAFRAANASRVVTFFRGFLAEEVATGQLPAAQPSNQQQQQDAPVRTAATTLEQLAAPGRAKPATGQTSVPADKPIITRAQIAGFYDSVRKGVYAGRDADRSSDEAIIFAAQREGRVR